MMRLTSSPAILPASLVAWRWSSLKYAGTVITAESTRFAEVGLGVGLELLQDHRGDLRRRVLLAAGLHARVAVGSGDDLVGDDRLLLAHLGLLAAHEALDREDRVLRVGDGLALGDGADETLAGGCERDDGRRRATTLGVLDDGGLATLEHGHARVRRAEVDAYGLGHLLMLLLIRFTNLSGSCGRFSIAIQPLSDRERCCVDVGKRSPTAPDAAPMRPLPADASASDSRPNTPQTSRFRCAIARNVDLEGE